MFQEFRSEFWQPISVSNHSITGFNTIVGNKIEVRGKKINLGSDKLDIEAQAGNSGLKITF